MLWSTSPSAIEKKNREIMQWQRIIRSIRKKKLHKNSSSRPVLNDHATSHSYPWTFLPSYRLGNPNSVHFYRNNLVGPQLRCSFERELDTPKYPHCFDQLRLGDLLLILLLSFLHIQQLLTTIITNIFVIWLKKQHFLEAKIEYSLACVDGIGCSSESRLYHSASSL